MFQQNTEHRMKRMNRRLAFQSLEARRLLTASMGWDGPGAGAAELTYHISNTPSSLSRAETTAAIETALGVWSQVADITFTPTSRVGLRDSLDFSFQPIDGSAGTLAQAYFPDDVNSARIAGDVQFDSAENWEVGNKLGNQAFDLVWVAVHEIGHALGLEHMNRAAAVLAPTVNANQEFVALSAADISGILQLYAPAARIPTASNGAVDVPASDVVNPATELPRDTTPDRTVPTSKETWRERGGWFRFSNRIYTFHFRKVTSSGGGDFFLSATPTSGWFTVPAVVRHAVNVSVGRDAAVTDLPEKNAANEQPRAAVPEAREEAAEDHGPGCQPDGVAGVRDAAVHSQLARRTMARDHFFSRLGTNLDGLFGESKVGGRRWATLSTADRNEDAAVSLAEVHTWGREQHPSQVDMQRQHQAFDARMMLPLRERGR